MVVACNFTNHRKDVSVDLVSRKLPKREASTTCTPWRVESRLLDLLNRTRISNPFWFSTHEKISQFNWKNKNKKVFGKIFFFLFGSLPQETREKKKDFRFSFRPDVHARAKTQKKKLKQLVAVMGGYNQPLQMRHHFFSCFSAEKLLGLGSSLAQVQLIHNLGLT
jgi:hypothetical protein